MCEITHWAIYFIIIIITRYDMIIKEYKDKKIASLSAKQKKIDSVITDKVESFLCIQIEIFEINNFNFTPILHFRIVLLLK